MLRRGLQEITEADLIGLVTNGVAEARTLEYKRDLPGGSDAAVKEFLADVTSLANAQGGDLIFGIDEKNGVASEVLGLAIEDPDAQELRLQNTLRDGVEPRLPTVHTHWVSLATGSRALILRVPSSLSAPHRIRFKNNGRFYNRNSRGKYEMDTHELRIAFTSAEQMPERLRELHQAAVSAAKADAFPLRLARDPAVVVSVIPLGFFRQLRDLAVTHENAVVPVKPSGGLDWLYTLDGLVVTTPASEKGRIRSYAVTHRSGRVDVAWTIGGMRDLASGRTKIVRPASYRDGLVGISRSATARLMALEIEGPWVAFISAINMNAAQLSLGNHELSREAWQDGALLGEIVTDELSEEALRPALRSFPLIFGVPPESFAYPP